METQRFGCAGITARLTLSLKYAAPETIAALEAGCHTIHVDAAVDIWAIGVIAFELLTGERAFPVSHYYVIPLRNYSNATFWQFFRVLGWFSVLRRIT